MKNIILRLIKFYRCIPLSSHVMCRHIPTCSVYTEQAIERFGTSKGLWLGFKRIIKCTPWGTYGYDPLPLKEEK